MLLLEINQSNNVMLLLDEIIQSDKVMFLIDRGRHKCNNGLLLFKEIIRSY